MNSEVKRKERIQKVLKDFDSQSIRESATALLNALGYYSTLIGNDSVDGVRFEHLMESALETANPTDKLRINDWNGFYQILQVTDGEIRAEIKGPQLVFESKDIDEAIIKSYMFVAMELAADTYTRTQLADITRFISKEFPQPMMFIFRYGDVVSLAIINRREHKRDSNKRVLEKVTLIKDIDLVSPKRAHIEILSELGLHRLVAAEGVHNFDTLHKAWERVLNTEALSKRFYGELEAWYEWAVATCKFPDEANEMQVIRMVTRLLFVWFLKEKGLVPPQLFEDIQISPPQLLWLC